MGKLDNPGTWIFHCHIDYHLSVGMALVLQIGNKDDWTGKLGPVEDQIDKNCTDKPPYPLGGGARINWVFQPDILGDAPKRCVLINQNVTFFWIDPDYVLGGNNAPPYDYRDHNVNYIGTGTEAKKLYDNCNNMNVTPLPSGDEVKTKPDPPLHEYIFNMHELGWNYFYCSLNNHCSAHNVKARVLVVDNLDKCSTN